jgi:hypothetical protein
MPVLQRSIGHRLSVPWSEFAAQAPELAEFGAQRLAAVPVYLAGVDAGPPRPPRDADRRRRTTLPVHGADLAQGRRHRSPRHVRPALPRTRRPRHGRRVLIRGRGERIDTPHLRAVAVQAASYTPHDRYVLFELRIAEARCNGYGDVALPEPRSWQLDRIPQR